jgi:hypothetical protein
MAIQIKLSRTPQIKVKTQIVIPDTITVLDDIDISNVQDGYVLMYNDEDKKYEFSDPDTILSKSVADNFLPEDFINKLDEDLDDRVNFDGGDF